MKDNEITGLALLGMALGALGKWEMFQKAGEKFLSRLVEGQYSRRMGRRFGKGELELLLTHEREELDTLAMLLQRQWKADRVTVVEYDDSASPLPPLATCTVEFREPRMASIKPAVQALRLESEAWVEAQRVHSSPSHYWHMPDVRDLEAPALRVQLSRWGVRSAYYQSLPTVTGKCGAMLSMSWTDSKALTAEELASLHYLVRHLAAVLRAIWAYQPTAA